MIKIKNSTIVTEIINHSLVDNIRYINAVCANLGLGMDNLILIHIPVLKLLKIGHRTSPLFGKKYPGPSSLLRDISNK